MSKFKHQILETSDDHFTLFHTFATMCTILHKSNVGLGARCAGLHTFCTFTFILQNSWSAKWVKTKPYHCLATGEEPNPQLWQSSKNEIRDLGKLFTFFLYFYR